MTDQTLPTGASVLPVAAPVAGTQANVLLAARARDLFGRMRNNFGLALIYAFLVGMVIFALYPIYFVMMASVNNSQALYTTNLHLLPTRPTLDNFNYILTKQPFVRWLGNSLLACTVATIIGLFCSVTGAYALSRFRFNGRQTSLGVLLALQAFPGLLALYAYYDILQVLGLSGSILGLGLIYGAGTIVFGVWNIKGYFDTLPRELEEAALVDGATHTQTFWRIMLPLAAPALAASALFMFIGGWNEYAIANLVLNSDPNSLTVPIGLFKLQDGSYTPWGWFAAASVIVSVPLMLLFLWLQRFFQSGLTIGSVKG